MDDEIRECLLRAFESIRMKTVYYERNILMCMLHVEKGWTPEEIGIHYKLSKTRVRQIFLEVCNAIYFELKYRRKHYHMPFYKKTKVGEIDYSAFKGAVAIQYLETLRKIAEVRMAGERGPLLEADRIKERVREARRSYNYRKCSL